MLKDFKGACEDFKKANYAILMFVLSAIMPEKHELVIKKLII